MDKTATEVMSENLDWEKIEARAQTDPWFRSMVDIVWHGGMTREQALIQGVLALADSNAALREHLTKALNASVFVPNPNGG